MFLVLIGCSGSNSENSPNENDPVWKEISGIWEWKGRPDHLDPYYYAISNGFMRYYSGYQDCYGLREESLTHISDSVFEVSFLFEDYLLEYVYTLQIIGNDSELDFEEADFPIEGFFIYEYWIEDSKLHSHLKSIEVGGINYEAYNEEVVVYNKVKVKESKLRPLCEGSDTPSKRLPLEIRILNKSKPIL